MFRLVLSFSIKLKFLAQIRQLETINEASELKQFEQNIFSWMFQHTSQIVELSLRVLFTKQIEDCLNGSKTEELKVFLIILFEYIL